MIGLAVSGQFLHTLRDAGLMRPRSTHGGFARISVILDLGPQEMKQGGWTETAAAAEVDLALMIRRIRLLAEAPGQPETLMSPWAARDSTPWTCCGLALAVMGGSEHPGWVVPSAAVNA